MSPFGALAGRTVTTGHGTQNDFVLVADPQDELDLSPGLVAAVCDRRTGIGADGLIRVVPEQGSDRWFMDYRNADGSLAEMCGNGVRVFVHYLRSSGLIEMPDGASVEIGTRSGPRTVTATDTDDGALYTVDMGEWGLPGGQRALDDGFDVLVEIPGLDGPRAGLRIDVPNPHTVVALPDEEALDSAVLELTGSRAPRYQPAPESGTNLELALPLGEQPDPAAPSGTIGVVRMRVLERGVGETRSCGTGTCAAALAARAWGGAEAPDSWRVIVPGGEVRVDIDEQPDLPPRALLTGPAVLTADVVLR